MKRLIIVGAGGHGKVVADTAEMTGEWDTISFVDDKYPGVANCLSWQIIGNSQEVPLFTNSKTEIVVAVGNNSIRYAMMKKLKEMGFTLPSIIHPTAVVSRYASVEEGTVVFANAVVNADARIGPGSIINTGCTVDHDCLLGAGVHISPGVHLAGNVSVGNFSWIGIGASIIPNIRIGSDSIIGAGAVVIRDVEDCTTVVGVPGKVIERSEISI